jgi:hypothetical protein
MPLKNSPNIFTILLSRKTSGILRRSCLLKIRAMDKERKDIISKKTLMLNQIQ